MADSTSVIIFHWTGVIPPAEREALSQIIIEQFAAQDAQNQRAASQTKNVRHSRQRSTVPARQTASELWEDWSRKPE